jgi:hypothetical protein
MSVSRIERLFDTHAKPGALVAYNDKGTRLAVLGKVGMPNAERVEVMIWDTETDRLVHSPYPHRQSQLFEGRRDLG